MEFAHSDEQVAIAGAIDEVIEGLGATSIARAWAAGDHTSGLALWEQLSELGLGALRTPEAQGGMGGDLTDLALVFERFGYHAVPGPYIESMAVLPRLVSDSERESLEAGAVWTVAVDGVHPHALDGKIASRVFHVSGSTLHSAEAGESLDSITPFRTLTTVIDTEHLSPIDEAALEAALDEASIANSALLLGAGERLLTEAVEYAKVREQFGRAIGEYQSLKHQLADVRVALSFARPLLWNAALAVDSGDEHREKHVSAAKIRAAEAAQLAARVSLQVHGAIGYTAEHDLSLWLNWIPALVGAWGTPASHRERLTRAILSTHA